MGLIECWAGRWSRPSEPTGRCRRRGSSASDKKERGGKNKGKKRWKEGKKDVDPWM
jgi:hypothetical protein